MGIGTTVKNMLGNDNNNPADVVDDVRRAGTRGSTIDDSTLDRSVSNDPSRLTNSNRAARLPSGTGPGTSGKGDFSSNANRLSQGSNFARGVGESRNVDTRAPGDISGYGTDAAAAAGGSLSGSHQATAPNIYDHTSTAGSQTIRDISTSTSASGPNAVSSSKRASQAARENIRNQKGETISSGLAPISNLRSVSESSEIGHYDGGDVHITHEREVEERHYDVPRTSGFSGKQDQNYDSSSRTDVLFGNHQFGHSKSKDLMPNSNAEEDTKQLQPVTHERVRHIETEEVARVKEVDRHIHHIQHHTQPVVASEELVEQIREHIVPVTNIHETHTNKVEDNTLFQGQVHQHHDTLTHGAKERSVIDKGVTVTERVHHHVHHVIQPIIEKETIDKQRIRTTIPIHEVTHEAPVVHQSQTHAPVPLEHFLSRGGTLQGAISQDQISKKVLRTGQCAREVDGVAESLEKDLQLGKTSQSTHVQPATTKVVETDEQIRTTVAPVRN